MSLMEAKKQARLLLGCYRTGDANDPEVYVAAVVAVLSKYPMHVMRMACDPNDGLPSKIKWLPTIAEVSEECRRLHDYDLRMAERERRILAQIEERKALPPPRPQPAPRGRIVTFGQAEQMMQENRGVRIIGVFDDGRMIPYRG